MPHRMLQQAIDLMREGKTEASARMLQVVIRDPELSNKFRATAYAWLAETQDDLNFKIQCLNRALDSDPGNAQIQERLNSLLAVQPSTRQAPVQRPPQPTQDQGYQQRGFSSDSQPINIIKPDTQSLRLPTFDPTDLTGGTTGGRPMPPNTISNPPPTTRPGTNPYPTIDDTGDMGITGTYPKIPNIQPNDHRRMPPPMSAPPPQQDQPRYRLTETPRVVGIHQGSNGLGTGVFITSDGIIATTRYVVGGNQQVTIALETGQEMPAKVIRTYPEIDLALLQAHVVIERVWPPTQVPVVSDNETFVVMGFHSNPQRGYKRKSKGELPHYWIQTSIELGQLSGAGGNAMFDSQNYLIGILTRNASRATGLTYGIHILHIYERVNEYIRELQQNPNAGYCIHCGNLTRAQQFGGFYCETCGATLPGLESADRHYRSNPQLLRIYNENLNRPCPNCNAKVGFHNGRCLRCDYDLDSRGR